MNAVGNQIGPRQFEFPPNIRVDDSAGAYRTVHSRPPIETAYGWAWWYIDSDRTPNGERNSDSSSTRRRIRRTWSWPAIDSWHRCPSGVQMHMIPTARSGRLSISQSYRAL